MVKIKIGEKGNQILTLIKVYAPTAMAEDREIDEFYEKLEGVLEEQRVSIE